MSQAMHVPPTRSERQAPASTQKYWVTAGLLYLSYFVLGFSLFAQAQYKPALSSQWGTDIAGVAAAIAWMMVGRLIAYPMAGPIADRVSRRLGAIIGAVLLALSFIGIVFVNNPTLGIVMCVVAGLGNGFLDPAVYPALSEIFPKRAHIANLFLKFSILVAQFLLPILIGSTGGAKAGGGFRTVYIGFTVIIIAVIVGLFFAPFPPNESMATPVDGAQKVKVTINSTMIMLMILGATTITTFTLWGNTNQELGRSYGMADPAITQSWYASGAMVAILISTVLLTKVRATQIVIFYPLVSAITLIVVSFVHQAWIVPVAGFIIGWTAAGGVLQLVTSTANSLFPRSRGLMTSLVMIASAIGGFAFQSLAAPWVVSAPGSVLLLNAGVTLVGVALAVFVDRAEKKRLQSTRSAS
jgi:predicted MFS family arabinose efflux permease